MAQSKALIKQVEAKKFIDSLATKLKEMPEFEVPEWAHFVKTSAAKSRPPQEEWWHIRVASVLRKIYLKGVIGVERLRGIYSSKKERGAKPERVHKAGGKIIRTILQQAEKASFVEKRKEGKRGRQLTKKGLEFMNQVINEILIK
ncbi:30S ribosomal protein S19e [Candidatus Pacearchaeota archaeon ex4484_26]|nr:MAG: 30S ribosomal protein S19e [Candidatus Pacearchaeota archaeon ex4484_26]